MARTRTAAATPLLALATLAAVGLAAPAARAQDVITFDAFANQPARTGASSIYQATNGSSTFDGVTFSGNAFVVGDQVMNSGSPFVMPHSGNYAFASGNAQTTNLGTTKTLYGLYLGRINDANATNSVTINALGAGNTILRSLTDTLTSTTLSLFDTSAFGSLSGITGYSLVSQNTNGGFDFAGDDFNFTAPAPPAPAPISGKFDFDTDSVGAGANPTSVQTTFTDTSGGITATFSSPNDSANNHGFRVGNFGANQSSQFPGFSGNSLIEEANNSPLTATFDQTLQSGSLAFNDSAGGQGTFTLQELLNGVAVGTPVSSSVFGPLSFGGTSFNGLRLSDTAPQFAIDNLRVSNASAAPEPSEYATLGFCALGLGALLLRAKKRHAA